MLKGCLQNRAGTGQNHPVHPPLPDSHLDSWVCQPLPLKHALDVPHHIVATQLHVRSVGRRYGRPRPDDLNLVNLLIRPLGVPGIYHFHTCMCSRRSIAAKTSEQSANARLQMRQ